MATRLDDLPRVPIDSRARWRAWLEQHYASSGSVWAVIHRKGRGPHVPYDDIVEEALCFGWIDGLVRKLDDDRSMLLLAPRKPGSAWSKPNKERVARLFARGEMAPAGLATVEAAKADGTWTKLDEVEALTVPKDLAAAFRKHAGSAACFSAFPRSAKRGILEWIAQAKRPETRARRVDETARLAARNERANQWKRK
jgi:uncharacterized protein YdeI (YjbR/CyaY-like superfamily)